MVRNKANIIVKDKEETYQKSLKKYENDLKSIFEEQKEQTEKVSNNLK